MKKIAIPVSRDRLDSPASSHFGKARWLLVFEDGQHRFVRNRGLNGRAVAETLSGLGCTDVVASHAGSGARAALEAAGIQAWAAPEGVAAGELPALLEAGRLEPMPKEPESLALGVHPCVQCAKAH